MKSQHLSRRISKQEGVKREGSMYIKSVLKVICIATTAWAMMLVAVTTQAQPPPFLLVNDPIPEASTWIHTGNGYVNQVVHPDILYFPCGWGNVDGVSYKYWMGITGYRYSEEKHEQPCILVSDSISDDTWEEPADNAYDTNPIPGWYWTFGSSGHFSDIDIVYNDDTDEIWAYFRNKYRDGGWERIELYKTADGLNWDLVSEHVLDAPDGGYLLSPTVVKEGNDWWMWLVDASTYDPSHLLLYHSTDGVNFTFEHDCGYNFRTSSEREPWHIDVVKYDGEYWGFFVERGEGVAYNLCLIKSIDGKSWSGYESPILDIDAGSWDDWGIYRTSFVIENGFLDAMYTAIGSDDSWYAGYTSHPAVGGSGLSSNIIPDTTPPVTECNAPPTIVPSDAPISFTATATDQCEGDIIPEITDFDCFKFTTKGKRIDKTGSCEVSIAGDTITILDSGGVGDNITWTIRATDSSGNVTVSQCAVVVDNPGRGH